MMNNLLSLSLINSKGNFPTPQAGSQIVMTSFNVKVIGPYHYDRIIHNKKNYAKRQDIGQTSRKMHLILKIKICVIR